MVWKAENNKIYKLVLLDTNALSEIVENRDGSGMGFTQKYPSESFAPAFTVYNLIEMRRSEKVFNNFIKFFSRYPCFLLKTQDMIFQSEIENYYNAENISILFNAFSSFAKDDSYSLTKFVKHLFSTSEMIELEKNWRNFESDTLESWIRNKDNFEASVKFPNNEDANKYLEDAELQTMCLKFPDFVRTTLNKKEDIDFNKFPALKVVLYSIYYRLYNPSWGKSLSDVTDVLIMTAAPYVDAIVTEKYQANIFDKIKNLVTELSDVEIHKLSHIRVE